MAEFTALPIFFSCCWCLWPSFKSSACLLLAWHAVMLLADNSTVHLGELLAVFLNHACLVNMVCCHAGKSFSCLPLVLTLLSASYRLNSSGSGRATMVYLPGGLVAASILARANYLTSFLAYACQRKKC